MPKRAVKCKSCGGTINYSDAYGPAFASPLACKCTDTPKGCADPDACACRERIAELERELLERANMTPEQVIKLCVKERAEERERCLNAPVTPMSELAAFSSNDWAAGYIAGIQEKEKAIRALHISKLLGQ